MWIILRFDFWKQEAKQAREAEGKLEIFKDS